MSKFKVGDRVQYKDGYVLGQTRVVHSIETSKTGGSTYIHFEEGGWAQEESLEEFPP